jgi:hypothetical protein
MSFSEKPLSIALMVWKYLLQGDPFRTRVSEGRSYLSSTIWSTEIVFAPDKISALKEEASSLFRDLPDTLQPDFFLATLAWYRGPCVAVVRRMGEIVGVVYGWEITFQRIPTGYIFIDDSLELAVASTDKYRDSVLKIAVSSWLSCKRIAALRITLARGSSDIDAIREVASTYSMQHFEELRELHPILPLPSSYEAFEKTLGSRTRNDIRRYRKYSQNENQCYVGNMDVSEFRTAVATLSGKSKYNVPDDEVQRLFRMVSQMNAEKRMLAGLRTQEGRWIAVVMGWKELGRGVLVEQFNDERRCAQSHSEETHMKSFSMSTLLRSCVIDQLIEEGFQTLWIYGATGGFLTRYTKRLQGVTIYLDRSTILWRAVRAIARFAVQHLQKEIANKLEWINPPAGLPRYVCGALGINDPLSLSGNTKYPSVVP